MLVPELPSVWCGEKKGLARGAGEAREWQDCSSKAVPLLEVFEPLLLWCASRLLSAVTVFFEVFVSSSVWCSAW